MLIIRGVNVNFYLLFLQKGERNRVLALKEDEHGLWYCNI